MSHIAVEMKPGTLKGMGREVECFLGMLAVNYPHQSRPSIQGAPNDLQNGDYVFYYEGGSISIKRYQGIWVL